MIGELHDLRCTNDPCRCERVYTVISGEQAFYNKPNRGETEDRLESRRLGVPAHPGRRAVRVIEVRR